MLRYCSNECEFWPSVKVVNTHDGFDVLSPFYIELSSVQFNFKSLRTKNKVGVKELNFI